MTNHWHADPATITRYADGTLDRANATSIEAHLLECERCRAQARAHVATARLDAVWQATRERIEAPVLPGLARVLMRLGVREHVARLIAATPSLRTSWFAAILIVVAWSVIASMGDRAGVGLFLALAPLIPLAGVAVCYGADVDPTWEVTAAAPYSGYRLFLLRALTVVVTSTLILGVGSAVLPAIGWRAMSWLLPAIAVAASAAVMSRHVRPIVASAIAGGLWVASLSLDLMTNSGPIGLRFGAFHAAGQVVFGSIALAAILLTLRSINRPMTQELQ